MKTRETVSIAATVVVAAAYVWLVYRTDRWNKFQYQDFSTKIADIAESKRVPPAPVHEYAAEYTGDEVFEDEKPPAFTLNIKGIGDEA